ncbi:MAG TPA: long-chain fatty acid--CoA ligase [Candidatus Binatia bacterium]|nr:long-chain fatty acid--CoA ligase [Candidatus Binatia bacterium]
MNLATAFAATAAREAKKTAVFWGEQEHSYERLLAQSRQVAAHLQQPLGVKPGDRVALWLKNCPQFISALFGVFQAGAVVVPINNFLKPEEVHDILADAGIDVILTDATLAEHLPALRSLRPQLRVWNLEELASPEGRHAGSPVNPKPKCQHPAVEDLAVIIYTSGTTGRPKGAMLTHANLLHNVESCRQVLAAADYDRFVVLLPMFHSFMLCVGVLLPLLVGGSLVLVRSLHPPKNVLQEIYQRRATILPAVPSLFRTLAGAPIPPGLPLRICISGGAPLPVEILREFNRHVPVPLIEGYGLSEASPVVSMNPLSGPWKEGSIGKPIPDVEMSVQDDAGSLLPSGATGEICVRGGNVMRGYWNQPEATAKTLRRGWLLTGDIGHRDADGYFYITDRKKDMLIVNGINVYPREIEEVLYQIPGVKEAAVVGMPDPRRGEQPVAFVAAQEGATLDERGILLLLRQKLADYKVPRRINFMPALPRNATGKVLKTALRLQA